RRRAERLRDLPALVPVAGRAALPVPVSLPFPLAPPVVAVVVVPIPVSRLPLALLGPLAAPVLLPVRRPVRLPLLPVTGRDVVVLHRHVQDGPRHEFRRHDDPR